MAEDDRLTPRPVLFEFALFGVPKGQIHTSPGQRPGSATAIALIPSPERAAQSKTLVNGALPRQDLRRARVKHERSRALDSGSAPTSALRRWGGSFPGRD